jgi:hypothetical protein
VLVFLFFALVRYLLGMAEKRLVAVKGATETGDVRPVSGGDVPPP